jgi:hypothetical protein
MPLPDTALRVGRRSQRIRSTLGARMQAPAVPRDAGSRPGGGDMPQKEHLPRVSDKEQRMYEHIKESELDQGRSTKRAKSIAAATVNKHHSEHDHSSGR